MAENLRSSSTSDSEDKEALGLSIYSNTSSDHQISTPQYESAAEKKIEDIEAAPVDSGETEEGKIPPLMRIMSRISTKSSWKDPGPPPDGGFKAWTQVAMAHLVIMNTWGFVNSFGVFESYYVPALQRPPSDIAWIGSIQVFVLFFVGTWAGRFTDAGYFREIFFTGTILTALGMFMTSISTQYYQVFLAQGLCLGLGNGLLFTPTLTLVATYFQRKRGLALGVAACGSATGGLIFPATVQQLLPKVGFGWTMRVLGFLTLGCLVVANCFLRQRLPPRRSGPIVELAAFKEKNYLFIAIGMFFIFFGVYYPFFYLGSFATEVINLPYSQSLNLLLVLNGVGVAGRLIPNHFADRYTGPVNIMIPLAFMSGVIIYCQNGVVNHGGLYGWAFGYGLTGAAMQSLFPAVLSSLTKNPSKHGVRMGMIFTITAFPVLAGPPIEGALITLNGGKYLFASMFGGSAIVFGSLFMVASRVSVTGWKLKVKI